MSRTRNQRRRDLKGEKILIAILIGALIFLLITLFKQFAEIEEMQAERRARESQQVTVMRAEDFVPKGFNPQCEAYQAALRRYDEENGLVLGQKEAAPELAGSEAVDTENSAS